MLNGFNFPLKKIHHQEKLAGYYKSGRLSFESVWKENSISYRTIAELTVWNERRKFGLKPPISHSLRHRPQRFYWRYLWKLLSRESTLSYGLSYGLVQPVKFSISVRKMHHNDWRGGNTTLNSFFTPHWQLCEIKDVFESCSSEVQDRVQIGHL